MIPYGRQTLSADDIEAVVAVLQSDYITQGPVVPEFERAVAGYCGCAHAVAVNSGTSALHLACLALDLGPGDRVWTSPITYVASANCARYCGAEVEFVDIDPVSRNLSVTALAAKLEQADAQGRLPRAVIVVHFAGQPCDMQEIAALARRYGFRIIEDAAHALGAAYQGTPVGACEHSDITVFSYHPVKAITTGEGGMALTNDAALARRLQRLRSHGIERGCSAEGPWGYEQVELGFNFRMTDIQAALGLSQLQRLDEFIRRRRELAANYTAALGDLPVRLPAGKPDRDSAWHLYVINLQGTDAGALRRRVFDGMRAAGIGVHVHYIPVYRQPYYARRYGNRMRCDQAEAYYASALSLPLHPALTEAELATVIGGLREQLA